MNESRHVKRIIDAHYHLEEQLTTVTALLDQMQQNDVDLIPRINGPFHLKDLSKKAGELLPRMLMSKSRFMRLLL